MEVGQCNIRSLNTSTKYIEDLVKKTNIRVFAFTEIWHPDANKNLLSGWKTRESSNIGLSMKPRKKLDYRFRPIRFDGEKFSELENKSHSIKSLFQSKFPVEQVLCDKDDSSWSTVSSISFDDSEIGMGYIYTDTKNQIFKSFSTEVNHQNTVKGSSSLLEGIKNEYNDMKGRHPSMECTLLIMITI